MRALAFWGICPETGPAGFSGRTTPVCACIRTRASGHKRAAKGNLQPPTPSNDNRYQPYRSDSAPAAVASLDWEGDWEEYGTADTSARTSQAQKQTWDNGFFAPVSQSAQNKPLKINRDLMLVGAVNQ